MTLDEKIYKLAAEEDNVVSRPELRNLKMSDGMIATCRRRKRWQTLHHGVYLLGAAAPTWHQRCRAALKAAGNRARLPHDRVPPPTKARLAGETGLAYLEVDGAEPKQVHLLVDHPLCPRIPGVKVHRTTFPDPGRKGPGMPTSSVERLLIDFAANRRTANVERAVESALSKGLTAERKLWEALAALPEHFPGVRQLARILAERPNGKAARSVLEIELGKVIRRSDLPAPVRNFDVFDRNGKHYEIDYAYPEVLGAIEADSRRYHGTKSQQAHDRSRQQALEALGFRFRRFTWRDVFGRPDWVVEEIHGLLDCAVLRA